MELSSPARQITIHTNAWIAESGDRKVDTQAVAVMRHYPCAVAMIHTGTDSNFWSQADTGTDLHQLGGMSLKWYVISLSIASQNSGIRSFALCLVNLNRPFTGAERVYIYKSACKLFPEFRRNQIVTNVLYAHENCHSDAPCSSRPDPLLISTWPGS